MKKLVLWKQWQQLFGFLKQLIFLRRINFGLGFGGSRFGVDETFLWNCIKIQTAETIITDNC